MLVVKIGFCEILHTQRGLCRTEEELPRCSWDRAIFSRNLGCQTEIKVAIWIKKISHAKWGAGTAAQDGCPIVQGHIGRGPGQPDLMGGIPAHGGCRAGLAVEVPSNLAGFRLTRTVHCRTLCQHHQYKPGLSIRALQCWMSSFFFFLLKLWISEGLCFDSSQELSLKRIAYKVWAIAAYFPSRFRSWTGRPIFNGKKTPTEKKGSLFRLPWFHTNIKKIVHLRTSCPKAFLKCTNLTEQRDETFFWYSD